MSSRLALPLALLAVLAADAGHAAGPPARRTISFREDIYPLLRARCLRCHQGSNPRSHVRLDVRGEWLGESNGRPLVVPGQASRSRLIQVVSGVVPDRLMPPPGRGKRLTAAQVALLRAWVDQGLSWDDALLPPSRPPAHWAFRPVRRPAVPRIEGQWARNPIDAFLAVAHRVRKLTPAGAAPRRVLIRRLYLDLVGLPPAPEAIDAFERDSRPDAYERLVEQLLASGRYGERYARHWLDVARYADSEGYESNHLRLHAYRYRDWVAASLNHDRPFADFIRLQIAGDEVRPYSDDNLIATGFLAAARLSSNEEDKARQRNDVLVDIVNTTASAFLGLTMHCAQCHNHKFDTITARDYYRFQAFFVRGQPANLVLRDPVLHARYRAVLPAGYDQAKKHRDEILARALARLVERTKASLPAAQRRALDIPFDRRNDEEDRLAQQAEVQLQFSLGRTERELSGDQRKEYDTLKKKLGDWDKRLPEVPQTFGYLAPGTAGAAVQVLPMKGFYPLPFDSERLSRLRSHLLIGGDIQRRGAAVEPGWPAVLGPTPARLSPTPRLALADWLANPKNPLVARVWVNRLWQWHFGRGLVATASDFGVKGAAPSHPELLDWLAAEFLDSGGSTKHIHRLIVRSAAYRLASNHDAASAARDPDNVYLWRWQPRRLEAEVIRDSLLCVAGELEERLGGPGDADETASRRRGLYLFQKRDHPAMLPGLFDGPSASAESCPRRSVSTVPLQALYLLNNRFARARARALAELIRKRGEDRDGQIAGVFRLALGRAPDLAERQACRRFFARHGEEGALEALCQAVLNTNEFVYLE
jgi:hypothetical protein